MGRPYARQLPRSLRFEIEQTVRDTKAKYVFFNLLDFPEEARHLRGSFGTRVRLIHLSHGLDSTDLAIDQQFHRRDTLRFDPRGALALGAKLQFEADYRRFIDASLCISPLDAEIERWLGARQTTWFGRTISAEALKKAPIDGRVGCVGTLDHPPNFNGFVDFFTALEKKAGPSFVFRLVGSPQKNGEVLARRFSFVEFLGRLNDAELRAEAASWCCFVHPVFAYARGCSTKVAVALGWRLPLATTAAGMRGYILESSICPMPNNPPQLADWTLEFSKFSNFDRGLELTQRMAAMQPSAQQNAEQLSLFVANL